MPKCDFNKSNFIKITLWHGCYPVNLMNILRRHQVGKGIPIRQTFYWNLNYNGKKLSML